MCVFAFYNTCGFTAIICFLLWRLTDIILPFYKYTFKHIIMSIFIESPSLNKKVDFTCPTCNFVLNENVKIFIPTFNFCQSTDESITNFKKWLPVYSTHQVLRIGEIT